MTEGGTCEKRQSLPLTRCEKGQSLPFAQLPERKKRQAGARIALGCFVF